MPTIDLTANYKIMDNPERLTIVNPNGSQVVTSYGFRRQGTYSYMDQNGVMRIESSTRWLIFTANVAPWQPEINGKISTDFNESFYINSIDSVANNSYYSLECSTEI